MLNGLENRCASIGNSSYPATVSETAAKNQGLAGRIAGNRSVNSREFNLIINYRSRAKSREVSKF